MPTPEIDRQVQRRLDDLYHRHRDLPDDEVANYIPPEMEEDKDLFAISICAVEDG